ncbi:MAG TPA: VOC family protein [Candidatus Limnocylindria bacterium]|nr:VOC family protein [Candidatus Limnocylindria bacterium]
MPALNAIGIVSQDLGASVRFYRLLGAAFPDPDGDHVEAVLPNGLRLMLDALALITSLDPDWTEPKGHRMVLAFDCASPAGVDATHAALTAAGHRSKTAPWDAFWGQRYAQVLDPDDNVVDLFAALPRAAS